ncbi:MAG: tetratricopeptide repeat protein [Myxococcota bacterium]
MSDATDVVEFTRDEAASNALVVLCEVQLKMEEDPARRGRLHQELGQLYTEAGNREKAAEHFEAALLDTPESLRALQGARRAREALGHWDRVPELLDREIALSRDASVRGERLRHKAEVLETRLQEPARALEVYEQALALDPGGLPTLKALERLYWRATQWPQLVDLYSKLAAAVSDPRLRAGWLALGGHLAETRLGDQTRAAQLFAAATAANPHATSALVDQKRLAMLHGERAAYVAALHQELALTQGAVARHWIRQALARVHEQAGETDAAAAVLTEALQAEPHDREIIEELVRLRSERGEHREEAEALATLVGLAHDADEAASISFRVGQLFDLHLGDAAQARQWYERAFDATPRFEPAALALEGILERAEDWPALLAVLGARARVTADPAAQAMLLVRMGALLEVRMGRASDAIVRHARALSLDPANRDAFVALTRLYAETGQWHPLAELYQRAVDQAPHQAEAIAWLVRLGAILEDRLDDPAGALQVYERVLALDSASLGALHAVQRAAERAGRSDRLVEAILAEAELTEDVSRRAELRHRAAVTLAEHVGDVATARRLVAQVLEEAPTHRAALDSLDRWETADGRWEAVVALCEQRLTQANDASQSAALALRIGRIRERNLGDVAGATQAYREALTHDPELREARDSLRRVLTLQSAWEDLASHLADELQRESAPSRAAGLAVEIGVLMEHRLQDPARALAAYQLALSEVPTHREALDAQHRLLVAAADWRGVGEAFDAEAAATDDPFLQAQATLAAALVRVRYGDTTEAREAAATLLKDRPNDVGAALSVEELGIRGDDRSALAAAYAKLSVSLSDPNAVLTSLRALLRIRQEDGGDSAGAIARIEQLAPEDRGTLELLLARALSESDRASELSLRGRLAAVAGDPIVAADHQSRIGTLLVEAGEAQTALAAFQAALALDSQSLSATRGFSRAAQATGDPGALQRAARMERSVTRDLGMAVRLSLDAAEALAAADQEEDAAGAYAQALEMDPDNPEAATGLMATMMRGPAVPHLVELLTHAAFAANDPSRACILHLSAAQLQADLQEDLPAAIAAVRRALSLRPQHEHAHDVLAAYLERNEQWSQAVEVMEAALPRLRGSQVDMRLRLARIREAHLQDYAGAADDLRAVLAAEPGHQGALSSLARVERLRGNSAEALEIVRALLSVATEDSLRGAVLTEMAQLEHARGAAGESAQAALSAIAIMGPGGAAGALYQSIPGAPIEGYQQALVTFLERPKTDAASKAAAYRELARVSETSQGGLPHAIATLRNAVQALPGDTSLSLSLINAFRRAQQDPAALAEARRLLMMDMRAPQVWRIMAEIFVAQGEPQGGALALAPLLLMGQAAPEEERLVRSRRARVAVAPPRTFARPGLEQLFGPKTINNPWAYLLPAVAEIIGKLEGIDYARWGISKRDRIRPGETNHVRVVADRIAAIFGEAEFDLFIVEREGLRHCFALSGSPPALIVPGVVASSRDTTLAFEMARPISLLARQLHPLDHLDDELLETLLVSVVRQFDPGFTLRPVLQQDELDALEREARRVSKAIGFFSRGRIQEAVQRFTLAPPAPIAAWARAVRLEASKLALLVADDLVSTIESTGEAIGPDNEASELARFWVSESAMMFRRAIAQRMTG